MRFFNIHSFAIIKKIEGGPFGDFEKLSKKMRFFNKSHSAEKSERRDPCEFFNVRSVAKYQKMKGGPFGDIKKFSKISLKKPKKGEGESHIVEKSENLLLRKICKKN